MVTNRKKERQMKKKSYADAVRSDPHLTGANAIPVNKRKKQSTTQVSINNVFSRIHSSFPQVQKSSVFERLQFPKRSVFERIEFPDQDHAKNKEIADRDEVQERENRESRIQIPKQHGPSSGPSLPQSGSQGGPVADQIRKDGLFCSRCLRTNHSRSRCMSKIRCYNCNGWGHIATFCRLARFSGQFLNHGRSQVNHGQPSTRQIYRKKQGQTSGGAQGSINRAQVEQEQGVTATHDPQPSKPCLDLELAINPQSSPNATLEHPGAPCENPSSPESPKNAAMEYNNIDPAPFMPRGFARTVVPLRTPMVRVVGPRQLPRNEDVAIVAIDPMPLHQVAFTNIRNVLGEFFRDRMRVRVTDIQPCPFAQAYVRFDRISDRDRLIGASPIPFDDVEVYLARHDRGPNHRRVEFNHVCWLLLIGFPLDYWSRQNIETPIASFGRLQVWEQDLDHLSRVMIKARVISLASVPKWIVLSEGDDFRGETWTVQCEIIHRTDPDDDGPQAEDPVPIVEDDVDMLEHDFFGFGQMEPGFVFGMPVPEHDNIDADVGPAVDEWEMGPPNGPPDAAPAAGEVGMDLDLNEPANDNAVNMQNENDAIAQEVPEPAVPEQAEEPQHQISLNLSFGSSGSSGSVEQQVDVIVPQVNGVQILPDLNAMVENAEHAVLEAVQAVYVAEPIVQEAEQPEAEQPVPEAEFHVPEAEQPGQGIEQLPLPQLEGQIAQHQLPDLNMVHDGDMLIDQHLNENINQGIIGGINVQGIQGQEPVMPNLNLNDITGEELLVDNNAAPEQFQVIPQDQNGDQFNQNIHLGFVRIEDEHLGDPVFETFTSPQVGKYQPNPDMIRLWAKHFSPNGSKDPTVKIPDQWSWFFTKMLTSPTHFTWAKSFLTSKAWELFLDHSLNNGLTFCLPRKCPRLESSSCSYSYEMISDSDTSDDDMEEQELTPKKNMIPALGSCVSTSALHKNRKRSRQPAVVETEVRRSDRLKGQNKCYKRSICPHKDCFSCSGAPPTLTESVIRNLGTGFGGMKPEALSTAALLKKNTKKVVIKKTTSKQVAKEDKKKSPNGKKTTKKPGN
ncbi:hypothetical protein EJB05_00843, partial [Eragrostis curvula]